MMKIKDKVAIVTGGAGGLGSGIVPSLAAAGADVVIADVRLDRAKKAAREYPSHGRRLLPVEVDISSQKSVEAMVARAMKEFGRLDILVNNAGIYHSRPWDQISEEEWDRVFDVNTKGCFFCARAAVAHMKKNKAQPPGRCVGKIVSISSITFFVGFPGFLHYVASKGGVIGFTRALARELGPDEITVNCISPGAFPTEAERTVHKDPEAFSRSVIEKQAIKRRGTSEDIGNAVLFLTSPASDFITGQTLEVDGGWYMH